MSPARRSTRTHRRDTGGETSSPGVPAIADDVAAVVDRSGLSGRDQRAGKINRRERAATQEEPVDCSCVVRVITHHVAEVVDTGHVGTG